MSSSIVLGIAKGEKLLAYVMGILIPPRVVKQMTIPKIGLLNTSFVLSFLFKPGEIFKAYVGAQLAREARTRTTRINSYNQQLIKRASELIACARSARQQCG